MIQVRREINQLGILFYSIFLLFPTKVGGDHVHKLQLGKISCPPPVMTALYLFGESFVNFLKIICFMSAGCKGRCCIALWWWQKGPCHQVWVISLTLVKIKLPKKVSSADQCSKLVFVQWVDQPQYNKGSLGTGKICLLQCITRFCYFKVLFRIFYYYITGVVLSKDFVI